MDYIFSDKFFYHVYPLGLCGCNYKNDFSSPKGNCFEILSEQLDFIVNLGINALYIGPVFESTAHGYDTLDYFYVDRRLGNNQSFSDFCKKCHEKGIAVVLDAVFNHTGRHFFAFKDLQEKSLYSEYKDWYLNVNFNGRSEYGDPFDYEGWAGCKDLVKLNVDNPSVRDYFFRAVDFWMDEFGIDGLRLDAADVLSKDFLSALSQHCKSRRNDFWLMGEVVHGDYSQWACHGRLDSVTNYQIYKAIWSSLNDFNFFELSYNLDREFGEYGLYKNLLLYNFLDNHDVNRIASTVKDVRHLYLSYALLFFIPGIPSVYYGSEYGISGVRDDSGDRKLRPCLPPFTEKIPDFAKPAGGTENLYSEIKRFAALRNKYEAFSKGSYKTVFVSNETFAFIREYNGQKILVAVNNSFAEKQIPLNAMNGISFNSNCLYGLDLLEGERQVSINEKIEIPAAWLKVFCI